MELFFMLTAMLALIGPIIAGRVRCLLIAPHPHPLPSASPDQRSAEAGGGAWPHEALSGKPDWCPKHAWATRIVTSRSEKSPTPATFARLTAALARADHRAPTYARHPRHS